MSVLPSTLHKEERIYSKKTIDALFQGGRSHSLSAFPLRAVYMPLPSEQETAEGSTLETVARSKAKILISVPKRCFKRAVKRNRVKRQIREAYRRHKSLVASHDIALAFIWLDNQLRSSEEVEDKVTNLLMRIEERLQKEGLQS
ncbi:MAG: ribonuclease P protein component [Prevotella sp.]|jgi:ribonuclease P protein component